MPSFEHTEKTHSDNQDSKLYQPGKVRSSDETETTDSDATEELMPTSQAITYKGDVAAAAELAAAEEKRREEEAQRPPRYIDADYGDPAPTIQQSIRVKPQASGPRKPGLRNRGSQPSEAIDVKGGGSFGEVASPSLQQESLSGNRVKNGQVEPSTPRQAKERSPKSESQAPARSESTPSQEDSQGHAPPKKRPAKKRPNNRPRKPRPEQGRGNQQGKSAPRQNRPAKKAAAQPEEPKGLFGKITKAIRGFLGTEEAPAPKPTTKPRGKQQGPKGKGQGSNNRGPRSPNQTNPDGSPKPRRRRGGRRGGRNRNRPNNQRDQQNNRSNGDAS